MQIEEMARIIYDNYGFIVLSVAIAEAIYNAGYRKASEVASETITEAIEVLKEKCLLTVRNDGAYCYEKEDTLFWLRTIPLKIEKKYTKSEGT